MKKIGVLVLLIFIFVLFSTLVVSAVNATSTTPTDKEEKAYSCLKGLIEDKDNCKQLNSEEQAFALLAMAYDSGSKSKCKSALMDKSKDDECWPKDACKLKDTSLALLALNNINSGTTKIENWLLSQNATADVLNWYLEIEISSGEQSSCTITYDGTPYAVTVKEDRKITGTVGSCLSLAETSYYLKISKNCYDKSFSVSCDKDFITTLLYKKKDSSTVYVSNKVSSAASSGMTEEKISASCFKQGNSCDYEGSLWATLALSKAGKDIKEFLPYLIALAEDNEKYFPSTILYIISGYDEYLADIIGKQKEGKLWQISSSLYNKFYDTSLALLALPDFSTEENNAKNYLLTLQDANTGCWIGVGVRDTAFILYSGWPKTPISDGGISVTRCEDYDYHCMSSTECDEAEGEVLENFYCSGSKICCSKPAVEKTCAEKLGKECLSGEECSTGFVSASNTNKCCLGECRVPTTPEESECEKADFTCRSECLSNEEEKREECTTISDICCAPKKGRGGWLIWLLIILIILVVLGIIFRNKLRVLLFKLKSRARKGPAPITTRPGFPPRPPFPPTRPGQFRPIPKPFYPRPIQPIKPTKPVSKSTDKEMEETFKKLKEMSK